MRFLSLLFVGALVAGCGHVAVLTPAPQGRVQFEGAIGGPMVTNIGNRPIPVPLSSAGVRYGLIDKLDVAAHAHLTTLAFGVGGVDVGGAYQVLVHDGWVPALTLSSHVYGFAGVRGGALGMADLTAAASYSLAGDAVRLFLAPTVLQPFANAPVNFSVGAGGSLRFGKTELQLETRWYQPTVYSNNSAVNWLSVGGQGGVGVVFGLRRVLGDQS